MAAATTPGQRERSQRARLLAEALDDFEVFCRSLVWILDKNQQRCNLRFNAVQRRFHERRTGRDIVLKPRQVGLSTEELARDIWRFLQPGQRVLLICQTDATSSYLKSFTAMAERMFDGLAANGLEIPFGTRAAGSWSIPTRDSWFQIIESGASQAAANKKGRGGTYSRVHSTEAAFYEFPELTLNAVLEGVPNGPDTEIVFESTAKGAGTWFHKRWLQATEGLGVYAPHFFPWFEQPEYRTELEPGEVVEPEPANDLECELFERHGISPEQLKWYRAKVIDKGQDLAHQEYPTDPERTFLASGRTFLDKAVTGKLLRGSTEPSATEWSGTLRIWAEPSKSNDYLIAADPSEGIGGDPGAALVYDRTNGGKHVATLHGQFPPWVLASKLAELGMRFNKATIVVERNNHGHSVLQALKQTEKYPRIFTGSDGRAGWLSTEVSRSAALDSFESAHRTGAWTTPDRLVLGECATFIVNTHGKAEASNGAHDDLVMAAAIGWAVLSRPVGATGSRVRTFDPETAPIG